MSTFTKAAAFAALISRVTSASTAATCANDASTLSCSGTSTNTCCINSPGGLFQQVQFWDTNPVTGPTDSWTIHGLWPNNCDGTYSENCDKKRAYTDITTLLTNAGETDTLSYMQKYWLSDDESDEKFWDHEWATHGTCISTLDPTCYTGYTTGAEAVDFFVKVVSLFQALPTHTWLESASITPSDSKTYALADMQSALESKFGAPVILLCQDTNVVYEIYYAYNVQGNVQSGTFVATSNVGTKSNCPATVKYPTKSSSSASSKVKHNRLTRKDYQGKATDSTKHEEL